MIHYHGTPCGATRVDVARFLSGRHALIPFLRSEDIGTAAEVCGSFIVDNSAYSAWKQGLIIDWHEYYGFVDSWHRHPAFDWAIIPDVIDGDEDANDELLEQWPSQLPGVPVWHYHESMDRLERLCKFPRVCLGSSGDYSQPGSKKWWRRTAEAMEVICIDGVPQTKLHGLRMLDPEIFTRIPFASADSTNAVRNSSSHQRFGNYTPPTASARMEIIASRIEQHQSPAVWIARKQSELPFSLAN